MILDCHQSNSIKGVFNSKVWWPSPDTLDPSTSGDDKQKSKWIHNGIYNQEPLEYYFNKLEVLLKSDNISVSLPEAVQWIMECHLSGWAAHLVMTNKKVNVHKDIYHQELLDVTPEWDGRTTMVSWKAKLN